MATTRGLCAFIFLILLSLVTVVHVECFASKKIRVADQCTEQPRRKGHQGRIKQSDASFSSRRREVLAALSASTLLVGVSPPACAAQTTAEAIRRSASNLPGYGQADVYYPPSFLGKWKVTRSMVESSDPSLQKRGLPIEVICEMRFISSNDNTVVVADRGFNQASLEAALMKGTTSDTSVASVRSYDWAASNPNVLTLTYDDGSSKEVKVTKRSTERMDDAVSSSEFRRVTTTALNGVPAIEASRVLTKWKMVNDNNKLMEGLELIYSEGSMGDPMTMTTASAKPLLLSKTRIRLEKET